MHTGQILVDCAGIVKQYIPLFHLPTLSNIFHKSINKAVAFKLH